MKEFRGRTAVITGGASGIGLATARQLASEGMNIVIADIEERPLQRVVADFQHDGVPVLGVRTDVGDLGQVRALADAAWERFGGVHVLFNNAGVAVGGPLWEMSHQNWEWVMRVNLWGVIHGVETFLPRMLEGGDEGHIVSTASFAGLVPNTGLGVYCVTKYGVVALAECLARDLRATRIHSSVLCPMRVATNIDASERNRPDEYGGPVEPEPEHEPELIPNTGLRGDTITADEVAGRVVQAIRDEELYIVTHAESREFIRRRFERIDGAFEREGVR